MSESTINNKRSVFLKRTILIVCILAPFYILFTQQYFRFIKSYKVEKLDGYFIEKVYNSFQIENWFNGDYQKTTEEYLNEGFGFRNLYLRLYNQLKFNVFKKTSTFGVVIGKENYLYEINYINAHNAIEYIGDNAINDTIQRIKFLQDSLQTLGKTLLIVMAPSKAHIYPEYIPDELIKTPQNRTYYDAYTKGFTASNVNYIDFNQMFLNKKNKSEHLLFPQLGVHWSRLEAVLATDTILKYLSAKSQTPLPEIKINSVVVKNELESPDDDIIKSMNLLYYPKHKSQAYPKFTIDSVNKFKKNIMVIADSYWWDIYLQEIPKNVFANNEFWYYNKEMWGNNYLGKTDPKTVDIKRHILQSDYIVLICTESNYDKMGFGFISSAINNLKRKITPTAQEIEDIRADILKNKEWVDQIKDKANKRNLTFDSVLVEDIHWRFQYKGPLKQTISMEDVIASIKVNETWLNEIREKAKKENVSEDEMIKRDARWFMETVLKVKPTEQTPDNKPKNFNEVVNFIRKTPEWMNQINEKAKQRGLSVDSMITLDAIWYMQENHIQP